MSQSAKLCFDFDGALVRENSSQLLMAVLLGRAATGPERGLSRLMRSRGGRLLRMVCTAASLLTGRDMRLALVLWVFRRQLHRDGAVIFETVAHQLTLTPELQPDYAQAFTIASTGLQPIIAAFLRQHPELDCRSVFASEIDLAAGRQRLRPVTVRLKVAFLHDQRPARFLTDYRKEAELYARLDPAARTVRERTGVRHTAIFEVTSP